MAMQGRVRGWLPRREVPAVLLLLLLSSASIAGAASVNPIESGSSSGLSSSTEPELCPCDSSNATLSSQSRLQTMQQLQQQQQQQQQQQHSALIRGMTCVCHAVASSLGLGGVRTSRDDYVYSPGLGAHKLHTRAASWNEARKTCAEEGGHLAIVNSLAEAHAMRELFATAGVVKDAPYPDLAFVGIHDLYQEGEWVTVLGESLYRTGYTQWSDRWGGQPDNGGGNQNCGGLLKDGGLDDVNCSARFAFFCELPTTYAFR